MSYHVIVRYLRCLLSRYPLFPPQRPENILARHPLKTTTKMKRTARYVIMFEFPISVTLSLSVHFHH
jgi:hypothetical protein